MSAIKRYMEDEVERIANTYGYSWDLINDCAVIMEWDLDKVESLAKKHLVGMYVWIKTKANPKLQEELGW